MTMSRPKIRFSQFCVSAVVTALVVSGCGSAGADKSGGSGGVTTLRLASPDFPGSPAGQDVEHFTERVRSLSGGRLRVEVSWDIGKGEPSWDQKAAQLIIDGDHDLGFIPAGAWDVLGVTSLQALQAPFLVTSDAALDAVVAAPVADDLMAGLDDAGVTGLALVPEGLRHPVGFGSPLQEPADFAGALIRAPRGDVSWEALRALGADPQDLSGDEAGTMIEDGLVRGAESSAARMTTLPGQGVVTAVVTANITLYAKANVLVAGSKVLAGLPDDQQAVLRQAATDTRDHAVATRQSDAEALAGVCSAGLSVAVATDEQHAAVVTATQPVREALEADGESGPILEQIAEIADAAGPQAPVQLCGTSAAAGPSPAPLVLTALEGVWRFEVTYQDGLDAGLPAAKAAGELGVQTVRMAAGAYEWSWRSRQGEQTCEGSYAAQGALVVFTDEPRCGGHWEARPQLSGTDIAWTDVRSRVVGDAVDQTVRELLHSTPWRKVQDLPGAPAFPEGVYRWRVTESDLTSVGVDGSTAYFNSGVITFTVADGRWLHHTDSVADQPDCGGTYEVAGARVTFTADAGPQCGGASGSVLFGGSWTSTDGGIRFTGIEPVDPFLQASFGTVWQRIS